MLFVHFDLKKKMFLIVNFIDLANFKKHHSSFFYPLLIVIAFLLYSTW